MGSHPPEPNHQRPEFEQPMPPAGGAGYGGSAVAAPQRSRKGLWITLSIIGAVLIAGIVVGVIFAVQAITASPAPKADPKPGIASSPSKEREPQPSKEADSGPPSSDALAERDQFLRDQQLQIGDSQPKSQLKAVTPQQKEFVADMKAEYAKLGANWDDQEETIALALTSDACETSILNSHDIDDVTVRSHVATSPLIKAVVDQAAPEQQAAATNGLAKTAVTGTKYMCPADYSQWKAAFDTINGNW